MTYYEKEASRMRTEIEELQLKLAEWRLLAADLMPYLSQPEVLVLQEDEEDRRGKTDAWSHRMALIERLQSLLGAEE